MESFLEQLGNLIAEQDLSIIEIIGALEFVKSDLLLVTDEDEEDDEA